MRCGICFAGTRRRNSVDKHLLLGESLRSVARRFGFSEDQVGRHRARHLQRALVQAAVAEPRTGVPHDYGTELLNEVRQLKGEAARLQAAAERRRDLRTAVKCFDSRLKVIEVQARMVGVLENTSKSVSVNFDVAVSEQDAARIVAAYLATRQPPALAPAPDKGAGVAQDVPDMEGTCIPSKSNGKIV